MRISIKKNILLLFLLKMCMYKVTFHFALVAQHISLLPHCSRLLSGAWVTACVNVLSVSEWVALGFSVFPHFPKTCCRYTVISGKLLLGMNGCVNVCLWFTSRLYSHVTLMALFHESSLRAGSEPVLKFQAGSLYFDGQKKN